jgi:hypothetical protein
VAEIQRGIDSTVCGGCCEPDCFCCPYLDDFDDELPCDFPDTGNYPDDEADDTWLLEDEI